jgi:uncharacterized protein YoxC
MKFKISNKAEIEVDEIIKIILIILAVGLIVLGIYLLRDKLISVFDSIKNFMRFGG